jgi:hypothetical protein
MLQIHTFRVFCRLSSDVEEERNSLTKIVNEINSYMEKENIQLKVVKLETDSSPGVGAYPQDVVNKDIYDDYDIFVDIMWTRFGTPTKSVGSGTAEESCPHTPPFIISHKFKYHLQHNK